MTEPVTAALIDTAALAHNLAVARKAATAARVMAVVKADAYGHGLAVALPALAAADALAVARIDEALRVRQLGYTGRVLLLEGALRRDELAVAVHEGFELTVHQLRQVEMLEGHAGEGRVRVWLKLDTGMHRLGFDTAGWRAAHARLAACATVDGAPVLMTHLANADDPDDPVTQRQFKHYDEAAGGLPGERSVLHSAGLLGWPERSGDWVRPGIMLYGVTPFRTGVGADLGLRPVMRFHARLIATRRINAGERVGYCGSWTAQRPTCIGTVAAGYGDGYPGNVPGGTPLWVNGQRVPLAGRVSMDMLTVDLGDDPVARVGDSVTLWGPEVPVEEIAGAAGRISYELLCGVSRRVGRSDLSH